ncbi:pantoate--beta-alanine ligase [Terrimonas sp. NA20]|uniref:Pantothenate synthetase n=1 Tax=Terrimonas ginsenosidimutans TaxID=2908004 RepID=A0ABS9KWC8_9BACT|nr:pantoate--beta-alanine ligase [Terrimonas ginsenosidimutans]MCG2616631.1 pantoate--beta-alanine ligase [Terrimonas ginsenosidimutans]
MILFKRAKDLREHLKSQQTQGRKTGFAPTMGALHDGHISLVEASRKENDITVVSIFVNPTQFNDPSDFEKYPVTIEKDIRLLEKAGCDVLFLPSVEEIYPDGQMLTNKYELGYLESLLEGKFRPGHFQGVCQVVHRLLEIVMPANLYMGQKDYQQCMVIKKLLEITGLERSIKLQISPTLREPGGLAMSSRNVRLSTEERSAAIAIFQALDRIRTDLKPGDTTGLKEQAFSALTQQGFRVDYVEIADASTLKPCEEWNGQDRLVALAAAFLGGVRLIDNLLLN